MMLSDSDERYENDLEEFELNQLTQDHEGEDGSIEIGVADGFEFEE